MKEKPNSMVHKEWFVKKLSLEMNKDEALVANVIKHQFDSVVAACNKKNSVEISGFGKLIWNTNVARRKLDVMDNQIRNFRNKISDLGDDQKEEELKHEWTTVIDEILIKRQMLINRINEYNANLRGVEKQAAPKKRVRGIDFTDGGIKNEDL